MPLFLIATYANGRRRMRGPGTDGNTHMARLSLPDEVWLREKLAEVESPTPLARLRGWDSASWLPSGSGLVVTGLVEATMEHHLANLFTVRSFEEEVLWQYFRKSLAAVSLRVRRLSKLAQPITVHRDADGNRLSTTRLHRAGRLRLGPILGRQRRPCSMRLGRLRK